MSQESQFIIFILVALLVFREIYHSIQMSRLIDKLMSRSYTEYQQAKSAPFGLREKLNVKLPTALDEDLGSLSEFSSPL